jgi:hypothetical protein
MSLMKDFAERTRSRITEIRGVLVKLRETSKDSIKQIAKIDKQHVADRGRIYDLLGKLADDLVEELPEEASDVDIEHAYALQEPINDLSADTEEISLLGMAGEDLETSVSEAISGIYNSLKEAERQLAKVQSLSRKLNI